MLASFTNAWSPGDALSPVGKLPESFINDIVGKLHYPFVYFTFIINSVMKLDSLDKK